MIQYRGLPRGFAGIPLTLIGAAWVIGGIVVMVVVFQTIGAPNWWIEPIVALVTATIGSLLVWWGVYLLKKYFLKDLSYLLSVIFRRKDMI